MHRLHAILERLSQGLLLLASLTMAAATLIVFGGTIARYGFSQPLAWGPDVIGYLMCLMVLLAIPVLTLRGGHVSIDILVDLLPGTQSRRLLHRLLAFASAITLALLCKILLDATLQAWKTGAGTAAGFPLPRWWFFAAMFAGFALSALIFLVQAVAPERPAAPLQHPQKDV
ncbi:TRAP transporter small permease [Salipiger abyssi]|uniref:TRAP transporter small permease n=1 Tax=Salipiger abyssi TaxID=1250539 RepID=UPI001A8FF707|nr:TRAP transporter small permease subunit [Salipiger abyssi]MBN9888895.1 TRAP transporter small permease subunit [Salipiger abyssi]